MSHWKVPALDVQIAVFFSVPMTERLGHERKDRLWAIDVGLEPESTELYANVHIQWLSKPKHDSGLL